MTQQSPCAHSILPSSLPHPFYKRDLKSFLGLMLKKIFLLTKFVSVNLKTCSFVIFFCSHRSCASCFKSSTTRYWVATQWLRNPVLNLTKLPALQKNSLQNRKSHKLHFTATKNVRCQLNTLPNHLKIITKLKDPILLKLSKETYKQKCKKS